MVAPQTFAGPVVGIGASAGGMESLLRFVPRLNANGRIRYVMAQHMAKGGAQTELVVRVLTRMLTMPVVEARDGDLLEPDRLYVIPANYDGVLSGGRVRLQPPLPNAISTPSVNVLFNSIAEDAGSNSVGVVLSGAGPDGVVGCRRIKACGGRVLVESVETAKVHGMPGSVERAGIADAVLSPEDIADRLNALSAPLDNGISPPKPAADSTTDASHLQLLLQEVSRVTGVDFSSYREETLLRRLRRHMDSLHIAGLEEYLAYARQYPGELEVLRQLFVVSLSWFYRDRPALEKLRDLLAVRLATKPPQEAVRAWVPGCASGEECYTLAMLLLELTDGQRPVEIVGSDLNPQALEIARSARYKASALKEMPSQMQAKYILDDGESYVVREQVRELCTFREEDVIEAEPPRELDLVSCRNLLIYMRFELQDRLLGKFYRALRPDGLLLLGLSERVGPESGNLFAAVDVGLRLFRRLAPVFGVPV